MKLSHAFQLCILKLIPSLIGAGILSSLFIQSPAFSQDAFMYLGQEPPGDTPKLFPPDSLLSNDSWFWHGPPIFSPNLTEMHWNKYVIYSATDVRVENFYMRVEDGKWTAPQRPGYANVIYHEKNPFFHPDASKLYFISEGRAGGYIFCAAKTAGSWTQPEPVQITIPAGYVWGGQFSIARNNTFYLDFDKPDVDNSFDIYRANWIDNRYEQSQTLDSNINTEYNDYMPFIDPDEEYIIFRSNRPGGYGNGDLYISFRNNNGTWAEALNLGPQINSTNWEGWPYVSPDKKYLFFISLRDGDYHFNPYWVSADVIEHLRPPVGVGDKNESFPEEFILLQNYPNPFNPETMIEYGITEEVSVKITIYNTLGQVIRNLVEMKQSPGYYKIQWDGKDDNGHNQTSGLFLYRIVAGDYVEIKKMTYIK